MPSGQFDAALILLANTNIDYFWIQSLMQTLHLIFLYTSMCYIILEHLLGSLIMLHILISFNPFLLHYLVPQREASYVVCCHSMRLYIISLRSVNYCWMHVSMCALWPAWLITSLWHNGDNVIGVMSLWALSLQSNNRKPVLQTAGEDFWNKAAWRIYDPVLSEIHI